MQVVERSFKTFEEIMEVINAVIRRSTNVRIYVEEEVVASTIEATKEEKENGKIKTPLLVPNPQYTDKGLSLLTSIVTPNKITNFDFSDEPDGKYYLRLGFSMEY